jgi:hypothetical protein
VIYAGAWIFQRDDGTLPGTDTSASFDVLLRDVRPPPRAVASCFTEAGFAPWNTSGARAFLSAGVTSRRPSGSYANASPRRLIAAFSSRSSVRLQTSHSKTRSLRLSVSLITPQPEHVFDDG